MYRVFWEVFLAVFGALLGWTITDPDRVRQAFKFKRNEWLESWWCVWYDAGRSVQWIADGVRFQRVLGLLRFVVVDPGSTYNWEATGKIGKHFYTGEWHSVLPHSTSSGVFAFEQLPQGRGFVGYFIGTSDLDAITCFPAFITPDSQLAHAFRLDPSDQRCLAIEAMKPAAFLIAREPVTLGGTTKKKESQSGQ